MKGARKKNEKCIEPDMWHTYFSNLFKIPDRHSERLKTIHDKIKELEKKNTNFTIIL
jgi:hypothetical protein